MMLLGRKVALGGGVALIALICASAAWAQTKTFDIPAEDATNSIPEFANQAGVQIIAPGDQLKGIRTPAVKGALDVHAALAQLLAGTKLEVGSDDGQTILLRTASKNAQAASNEAAASAALLNVETMVVTGTNIHGVGLEYQASPLTVIDQDQIQKSGATDMAGLLRTVPQNFSGGAYSATPDGAFGNGANAQLEDSGVTSPNLRGLGTDSTLTLLNGHRLAPGVQAAVVDIGLIPLAAIDHVDILTDGASAIYGADAIGGVVNVVLKRDFNGVEATGGLSSDDQGHYSQQLLGATVGNDWGSGDGLVSVNLSNQTALQAKYRSFSNFLPAANTPGGFIESDLYPSQKQVSVLGDFRQQLSDTVQVSGDIFYGYRYHDQGITSINTSKTSTYYRYHGPTNEVTAALSLEGKLPGDWQYHADGLFAFNNESPTDFTDQISASGSTSITLGTQNRTYQIYSFIPGADGTLFDLPAGPVKAAIGGEYREEQYHYNRPSTSIVNGKTTVTPAAAATRRGVGAVYAEADVPVISPSFDVPAVRALSLTAAVRYDNYSDVGDTTNYKVGVKWELNEDLSLRGTRSTSFRAPDLGLTIRDAAGFSLVPLNGYFTAPAGGKATAILEAGYATLVPQTSTANTLGVDFTPSWLPAFKINATWFDYDYVNRFGTPPLDPNELVLSQYAPLVTPVTSATQVQSLVTQALATGGTSTLLMPYSQYQYIVNREFTNLGQENVRGFDIDASYAWDWDDFHFGHSVSLTYLARDTVRVLATSGAIPTVGLVNDQPHDRVRGTTSVAHDQWSITAAWNYTSSFVQSSVAGAPGVSEWLTMDLTGQIKLDDDQKTVLSLSIVNLFNTNPPYVSLGGPNGSPGGPFYDPANANPLGRVYSLNLKHDF